MQTDTAYLALGAWIPGSSIATSWSSIAAPTHSVSLLALKPAHTTKTEEVPQ